MQLLDITPNNWRDIIHLTTNKSHIATIEEKYVPSAAFSIIEAYFSSFSNESEYVAKAIEHRGKIIGFVMYNCFKDNDNTNVCTLNNFFIDINYQGRGHGSKAMDLLLSEITQKYSCVEIFAHIHPDNKIALSFFDKNGFDLVTLDNGVILAALLWGYL